MKIVTFVIIIITVVIAVGSKVARLQRVVIFPNTVVVVVAIGLRVKCGAIFFRCVCSNQTIGEFYGRVFRSVTGRNGVAEQHPTALFVFSGHFLPIWTMVCTITAKNFVDAKPVVALELERFTVSNEMDSRRCKESHEIGSL